jgi:hypothetical protein
MLFYAENMVKMDRIFCLLIGRAIIMVHRKNRMKMVIFLSFYGLTPYFENISFEKVINHEEDPGYKYYYIACHFK